MTFYLLPYFVLFITLFDSPYSLSIQANRITHMYYLIMNVASYPKIRERKWRLEAIQLWGGYICMYSRLKQSATLKRTHNYHIRELTWVTK